MWWRGGGAPNGNRKGERGAEASNDYVSRGECRVFRGVKIGLGFKTIPITEMDDQCGPTPDTSVDDENFGKILYTSVGPRQVQLAVKFNF